MAMATGPTEKNSSPLIRPPILDEVLAAVSAWTRMLVDEGLITEAYLFGSAINEDGCRFDSGKSDLDINLCVPWEGLNTHQRIKAMRDITERKYTLEVELLGLLGRSDASKQIASIVPMTAWEIENAINIMDNNIIIKWTHAYDLVRGELVSSMSDTQFSENINIDHRKTLGVVQQKRSTFTGVPPNKKRASVVEADGNVPMPKKLMRQFAVATVDMSKPEEDHASVARGQQEITLFVFAQAKIDAAMKGFADWLNVMGNAPGTVDPTISEDHYMIIVETIFDKIRSQYGPVLARSKETKNRQRKDNETRRGMLEQSITDILKKAPKAMVALEKAMEREKNTAGNDDDRAAGLVKIMVHESKFPDVIAWLEEAREETHPDDDAVIEVSKRLIPWIYIASYVEQQAWWEKTNIGDIVDLPAGLVSFAEIIMAGIDKRSVLFEKIRDPNGFPPPLHGVNLPPEGGPDEDGEALARDVREDLLKKLSLSSETKGKDEKHKDNLINRRLESFLIRKNIRTYWVCNIPSGKDESLNKTMKIVAKMYPPLAVVAIKDSLGADQLTMFDNISTLLDFVEKPIS